jgi:hypothetical protein
MRDNGLNFDIGVFLGLALEFVRRRASQRRNGMAFFAAVQGK